VADVTASKYATVGVAALQVRMPLFCSVLRICTRTPYLGTRAVCCVSTLVDMNNQQGLPPRPTIKQAAQYHQVDVKTIRRWIAQGRRTAFRVGPRLLRLDRDSVINVGRRVGGGE
jgi:excisionase family DNA binding protein